MSDADEFVTDEELADELALDHASMMHIDHVLPLGIKAKYEQESVLRLTPQRLSSRVRTLMVLLFVCTGMDRAVYTETQFDGLPIAEYVIREANKLKEQAVVRQWWLERETTVSFLLVEEIFEDMRSGEQQANHDLLSARLREHGLHGMYTTGAPAAAAAAAAVADIDIDIDDQCVVCNLLIDGGERFSDCAHPPCMCKNCEARVERCPICRAES